MLDVWELGVMHQVPFFTFCFVSLVHEINNKVMTFSASHITDAGLLEIAKGEIKGHSLVHKFGATLLTTTIKPVTQSGFYRTPQTATALEMLSTDAADGVGGIGARQVTIIGLDSSWNEIEQVVTMNGTTAVAIPISLTRVYRLYVSSTGTYSSATDGSSHVGDILVRESGGGDSWAMIENTPLPMGQSQIGVYTIPIGYTAFVVSKSIFVDTTKVVDLYFFYRDNCDDVTVPYSGVRRLIERELGITGGFTRLFKTPKGPFVGPCDIGFMGSVSVNDSNCSIEYELVKIENKYVSL